MKRKALCLFLVQFALIRIIGFEKINAEKEILFNIPIGNAHDEVIYSGAGEDLYKINGIAIDSECGILLTTSIPNGKGFYKIYKLKDNEFQELLNSNFQISNIEAVNQSGFIMDSLSLFYCNKDNILPLYLNDYFKYRRPNDNLIYIVPEGLICEKKSSKKDKQLFFALKMDNGIITEKIEGFEKINSWLEKQPGNFYVNQTDGSLYKDGFLYSVIYKESDFQYWAKLKSNHNINVGMKSGIDITNSNGEIELHIDFPWAEKRVFDIGIGSFGEIYCVIEPEVDIKGDCFSAREGSSAELVVVRNHLKYFGILTDDRIRLRKEASISSESLGTYPKNTGFYIIERGTKEETIGSDKGIWYHVRLLDGTEGWFFGAYVRDLYEGPGTPLPWPNVADWD